MPFDRPSLTELRRQGVQDVTGTLTGGDTLLRGSVLHQLSWSQAAAVHGTYGYLDWIAREAVPYTATSENLEAWSAMRGVHRKAQSRATGAVLLGPGAPGALVPLGTPVSRDDGVRYATTAEGRIGADGAASVPIEAEVAGAAGNADAGTSLTLGAAVQGVPSAGRADGPLTGGAEAESTASLRTRMLEAYARPPQGGSEADYLRWALEVPGVTRAFARRNGAGAGTVVVYAMLDEAQSARQGLPSGTDGVASGEDRDAPATGDQLRVAEHLWAVQPVTALVYAVAPVPLPVDVRVRGLQSDTAAIRAAVEASLRAMLVEQASVGGTSDPRGGVVEPNAFFAAVDAVPGVTRFALDAPSAPVVAGPGQIAVLGTLSFV